MIFKDALEEKKDPYAGMRHEEKRKAMKKDLDKKRKKEKTKEAFDIAAALLDKK